MLGSGWWKFQTWFVIQYSMWMIWRLSGSRDGTIIQTWNSGHGWCSGKGGGVAISLGWAFYWDARDRHLERNGIPSLFYVIIPAGVTLVTFTAHFMTSAVSSETTRSTHLRLGSFSLRICFLTIASKAKSGVKSPVLEDQWVRLHFVVVADREGEAEMKERGKKRGQPGKRKRRNKKRKILCSVSHF